MILKPVTDPPLWKGTKIAEAFSTADKTKMAAGLHEIHTSKVSYTHEVDDILYILEGEIEIESNGIKKTYHSGDFVYIIGGNNKITIKVEKYVKIVYVTYPAYWKDAG